MAASMACEYPGCTVTSGLMRCGNRDGRLVCARHHTLRNGSYVCAVCDEEQASAKAEEIRLEAIRRRQASDNEVHGFLRFGSIAAGVIGIILLLLGNLWTFLGFLLIGVVIASRVMSSGHRKGPLRDMNPGYRLMVWIAALVGAVIGAPVLIVVWIVVWIAGVSLGAAVKQTADEFRENQAVDRVLDRVDRRGR